MTVALKAGQMSAPDYAQCLIERFFLHPPGRPQMRTWQVERRKRTQHLIELGGLVVKALNNAPGCDIGHAVLPPFKG
jgi:hypothetical protein